MAVSIDVVIPSFRLSPDALLPILELNRPKDTLIKFYLVADNPDIKPDAAVLDLVDGENVNLLINSENRGASATRNNGMAAGAGDWILFLDDDVAVQPNLLETYASAIQQWPNEIGFIGVVDMPRAPTMFAKAVVAEGSMGIFTIAKKKPSFAWGATANMMVNRKAVGDVIFAEIYIMGNRQGLGKFIFANASSKSGGGEEVEFFLRVREQNDYQNYRSLPQAAVVHPWWRNGRSDFMRFFRYGTGNSFLAQRNPIYSFRDLLNTSETLLLCTVVWLFTFYSPLLYFIFATVLIDYLVTVLRVKRNTQQIDFRLSVDVALLRNVYEAGILWGNLSRGRIKGIGERFNYEGGIKKQHFRLNRFKIIKLVLYVIAIVVMLLCV